ncbi:MBL fold metallo-hydrolase [Pseudomonas solani]|uniref:MBL fold metallo-hydrolase n=1 Tax=Pseudomonas solani TaxID=2731552 RepID=UPI003D6AA3D1
MAPIAFLRRLLAGATLIAATGSALAQPLQLQVYNPGDKAVFPVTSSLILGEHDALLVDAQFSSHEADELVKRIQASGKRLTTIFISHGDPDFYFGLDTLLRAFPEAKVLATAPTIEHIKATKDLKLAYWGPILKDGAPKTVVVPQPLKGNSLELEGQRIEVIGLDGADPAHTGLWIPSLRTQLGGVLVSGNMHVWTADSQSVESRRNWIAALDRIEALKPEQVIPGHYLGERAAGLGDLHFTRDYLKALEQELPKAKNAAELTAAMKKRYPGLAGEADLELSAKVLKGEMQWP